MWFSQNFQKISEDRKPFRFWMNPGDAKDIVFVDDRAFSFKEHQVKLNGKWNNFFTCTAPMGEKCPLCEAKQPLYLVTMFTVIDTSEYTSSNGKVYKNTRKLLAVKPAIATVLQRKKKAQNESLVGCKFTVFRPTEKDSSAGSDFEFQSKIDLAEYGNPQPFDYEQIFAPLTRRELLDVMGVPQIDQSEKMPF